MTQATSTYQWATRRVWFSVMQFPSSHQLADRVADAAPKPLGIAGVTTSFAPARSTSMHVGVLDDETRAARVRQRRAEFWQELMGDSR